MVLGKLGPTLFGAVANWARANQAPANWASGAANWAEKSVGSWSTTPMQFRIFARRFDKS